MPAQLERAIYWGFDVSHLDAHLDSVQLKAEFFDVFLDLAEEFRLPLRLPDAGAQRLRRLPVPLPRRRARRRVSLTASSSQARGAG